MDISFITFSVIQFLIKVICQPISKISESVIQELSFFNCCLCELDKFYEQVSMNTLFYVHSGIFRSFPVFLYFLVNCPSEVKPVGRRRYADDCFATFLFLDHVCL